MDDSKIEINGLQWMDLISVMKDSAQALKRIDQSLNNIHYELRTIANKR